MKRKLAAIAWPVLLLAFFLNPGFACGPAEPEFQYGVEEMRAAVEGTWSVSFVPAGEREERQVTVKVTQGSQAVAAVTPARARRLIRPAHACGSRTLVKSASACLDSTYMPLEVTFVAGDAAFATAAMSGSLTVLGTTFTEAAAALIVIRLGGYTLSGQITPHGMVLHPLLTTPGPTGTVTSAMRL